MYQKHEDHVSRRDSIPYSPPPTRAGTVSGFGGESSPSTARSLQSGSVTNRQTPEHESQEEAAAAACVWDSASSAEATAVSPDPSTSSWSSPTLSDRDIDYTIYIFIQEQMDPGGFDISLAFERATLQPPITTDSLAELDIPQIINNPKLRHDVNFDRELHFRPNLDGSKGRAKIQSADQYWKALEGELFMYGLASERMRSDGGNIDYWQRILQSSQRRLRKIFEAIRDILKTLVPDHEQKSIMEMLDVDLIMQEIINGVCDLISLSSWLARVLKAHCAPMRDDLVDSMMKEVQAGAMEQDQGKLVNGLRQLLQVLESMKLDVANHQIRHMRPLLIEDTINFQKRYNAHRIKLGKINIAQAKTWLSDEIAHLLTRMQTPTDVEALSSALMKDLLFNETNYFPQTFYLDLDRLRVLRTELHSRVYHGICKEILIDLAPHDVSLVELQRAQAALHVTITAIVGTSGRFLDRRANIAVEITRILLMLERRNSPLDTSTLGLVEQKLESDLNHASPAFDKHANDVCSRILPKVHACVEEHIRMSAIDLQDALVPPLSNNPLPIIGFGAVCAPAGPPKQQDPDEDMIKRLTHVIVLHWHVWRDLAYFAPVQPEEDVGSSQGGPPSPSPSPSPSSSPSASPIISATQEAEYAPDQKLLLTGIPVTEVSNGMPTPAPSPAPVTAPTSAPAGEPVEAPSEQRKPSTEQSSHDRHDRQSA